MSKFSFIATSILAAVALVSIQVFLYNERDSNKSDMCVEDVELNISSLDGKFEAQVVFEACDLGFASSYTRQSVYILLENHRETRRLVFTTSGMAPKLEWRTSRELNIELQSEGGVQFTEVNYREIHIIYLLSDELRKTLARFPATATVTRMYDQLLAQGGKEYADSWLQSLHRDHVNFVKWAERYVTQAPINNNN